MRTIGIILVVLLFALSSWRIVAESGVLETEVFDPLCRAYKPPCGVTSLISPLLVTNESVFFLKSNESRVYQTLLTSTGTFATVIGIILPFNASLVFPGYTCSPHKCREIQRQISVFQVVLGSTSVASISLATPSVSTQMMSEIILLGTVFSVTVLWFSRTNGRRLLKRIVK